MEITLDNWTKLVEQATKIKLNQDAIMEQIRQINIRVQGAIKQIDMLGSKIKGNEMTIGSINQLKPQFDQLSNRIKALENKLNDYISKKT